MAGRPPRQKAKNDARQQLWRAVLPTWLKRRLGHPENYFFSLLKKKKCGSKDRIFKYPKKKKGGKH